MLPLILVLPDGIRLYAREASGVPREGDHALVAGVYYRVSAVVWQFGKEIHNRDLSVPAMPIKIYLQPALIPADLEADPPA